MRVGISIYVYICTCIAMVLFRNAQLRRVSSNLPRIEKRPPPHIEQISCIVSLSRLVCWTRPFQAKASKVSQTSEQGKWQSSFYMLSVPLRHKSAGSRAVAVNAFWLCTEEAKDRAWLPEDRVMIASLKGGPSAGTFAAAKRLGGRTWGNPASTT